MDSNGEPQLGMDLNAYYGFELDLGTDTNPRSHGPAPVRHRINTKATEVLPWGEHEDLDAYMTEAKEVDPHRKTKLLLLPLPQCQALDDINQENRARLDRGRPTIKFDRVRLTKDWVRSIQTMKHGQLGRARDIYLDQSITPFSKEIKALLGEYATRENQLLLLSCLLPNQYSEVSKVTLRHNIPNLEPILEAAQSALWAMLSHVFQRALKQADRAA